MAPSVALPTMDVRPKLALADVTISPASSRKCGHFLSTISGSRNCNHPGVQICRQPGRAEAKRLPNHENPLRVFPDPPGRRGALAAERFPSFSDRWRRYSNKESTLFDPSRHFADLRFQRFARMLRAHIKQLH